LLSAAVAASLSSGVLVAGLVAGPAAAQEASPTPSPTLTACGAPDQYGVTATPEAVAPGDTVTVGVLQRRYPCHPEEPRSYPVTLYARPLGGGPVTQVARGETDRRGQVRFEVQPDRSTEYSDNAEFRDGNGRPHRAVTVSRSDGSCAGVVELTGPSSAPYGAP
jgi:hypothetical protein